MKSQKDMTPEMSPPGQKVSNMLLGKSGEIAPERMKKLAQSRSDTLKYHAIKTILNSNLEC